MAGYYGYSMSNNAMDAYESGEMPKSKWTKQAIIVTAEENEASEDKLAIMRKASAPALKKLLAISSWHHTSSYFNRTDFYSLDVDRIEDMTIDELKEILKDEPKADPDPEVKALCEYLVWTGTRKHPKATATRSEGIIKGNWFYLPDGSKKSTNANGFRVIERY